MTSMRTPTNAALLEAAATLADLKLEPERLAQLVPAMDGFYTLIDRLHADELGETPPAIAFHAGWPGR